VTKNTKMKKTRIVILGDSLGLPRPKLKYEMTYPVILQNLIEKEFEVISRHRGLNDSEMQTISKWADIKCFEPNILVIHLGIVDYAPRLFSRSQELFLRRHPSFLTEKIISFKSRNRLFFTKYFPKVYVKPKKYEENIVNLIEYALEQNIKKIILINIVKVSEQNKLKSYNFENNITTYNDTLSQVSKDYNIPLIDMYNVEEKILLNDGIHLNKHGNEILASKLNDIIFMI